MRITLTADSHSVGEWNHKCNTPKRLQKSSEEVRCLVIFALDQVFRETEFWWNEDCGILYADYHVEEADERNRSREYAASILVLETL